MSISLSVASPVVELGAYKAQGSVLVARLFPAGGRYAEPVVCFYDGSQKVSEYLLGTLLKFLLLNPNTGLCLWGDVPAWTMPAESMRQLAVVLGSHLSRW